MKKPICAFFLTLLFPGLGLAYLGKWKLALINIGFILAVAVIFSITIEALKVPDPQAYAIGRVIGLILALGSAALAHQVARKMRERYPIRSEESSGDPSNQ